MFERRCTSSFYCNFMSWYMKLAIFASVLRQVTGQESCWKRSLLYDAGSTFHFGKSSAFQARSYGNLGQRATSFSNAYYIEWIFDVQMNQFSHCVSHIVLIRALQVSWSLNDGLRHTLWLNSRERLLRWVITKAWPFICNYWCTHSLGCFLWIIIVSSPFISRLLLLECIPPLPTPSLPVNFILVLSLSVTVTPYATTNSF